MQLVQQQQEESTTTKTFEQLQRQHIKRLKKKEGLHKYAKIGLIYKILNKLADAALKGECKYFRISDIMGHVDRYKWKRTADILEKEAIEKNGWIQKQTYEELKRNNPRNYNFSNYTNGRNIRHKGYYYSITASGLEFYNKIEYIFQVLDIADH